MYSITIRPFIIIVLIMTIIAITIIVVVSAEVTASRRYHFGSLKFPFIGVVVVIVV